MRAFFLGIFFVLGMGSLFANEPHLMMFFYNDADHSVLEEAFDKAVDGLGDQVLSQKVNVDDPSEATIIGYYNLQRASMPLVMVFAPNGAVVGRFGTEASEVQLRNSLGSNGNAHILSSLQAGNVVFVCVPGAHATSNCQALRGVKDFLSDRRHGIHADVITVDPSDVREHSLLASLKVNLASQKPTTVVLAPPSRVVGHYEGKTSHERIIADLSRASVEPKQHGPRCSCSCCGHH